MKKRFKNISIFNFIILIIGLFIGSYSENFRGQQPLYGILKMIAFGLLGISVLWSLTNTLLIHFENKTTLKQNVFSFALSAFPCAGFLVVIIFIIFKILFIDNFCN